MYRISNARRGAALFSTRDEWKLRVLDILTLRKTQAAPPLHRRSAQNMRAAAAIVVATEIHIYYFITHFDKIGRARGGGRH